MVKESLRIQVEGSGRLKILSSDLVTNYQAEIPENEIIKLQNQLELLETQEDNLTDYLHNLEKQKKLLESIEVKQVADKNKEISFYKFVPEDWGKLLDFSLQNSNQIDLQKRQTAKKLENLREKMATLENQIGQGRSRKTGTNQLMVTLESETMGDVSVNLSYIINDASWRPYYEIHTYEGKKIELHYMASIRQNTGEDWNNISVTLTTTRPAMGIDLPEINPLIIHQRNTNEYSSRSNQGLKKSEYRSKKSKVSEKKESVADEESAESDKILNEPDYESSQINEGFSSASFEIVKKTNIPGDNSEHEVMITTENLDTVITRKAMPFHNEFAFKSGKVQNSMNYALLPGKLNLFVNNIFIGSTDLPNTQPGESFSLPLGPDESLKIKYHKIKEIRETYGLGNKRIKTTYEYKTGIENLKTTEVVLDVFDRIPTSSDADIKVDIREISPKNDNDVKKDRGVLKWRIILKPKEKTEIRFSYTIDHPENMNIWF